MNGNWFAGRLRELREAAGLTQQQLAERAGMAWRSITHLEGGDRKPSWETVLKLCGVLNVDCREFTKEPVPRSKPKRGRPPKKRAGVPDRPAQSKVHGRQRKGHSDATDLIR